MDGSRQDGIRRYFERRAAAVSDDSAFLSSTIERDAFVANFRTAAEQRHLARVVKLEPTMDVLDLGGGSGRYALFFARRCRRVLLVDVAEPLLARARQRAERTGVTNLEARQDSILSFETPERFHLVFVGGVLNYLEDEQLPAVAACLARLTAPGGSVVLREPVSPAGRTVYVDREDSDYRSTFRAPHEYATLLGAGFRLVYQRKTVSHLIPRALGRDAVAGADRVRRSGALRALARVWLPVQARFDYHLLSLEERLRAGAAGRLLADPGIVQHFYVFEGDDA
jgi:SAM-dependent methyltransferase